MQWPNTFQRPPKHTAQEKHQAHWHYDISYVPGTPRPTIYKWLFQLDDSKSLYRKWVFRQTSILNWLFGVPGIDMSIPFFRDFIDFKITLQHPILTANPLLRPVNETLKNVAPFGISGQEMPRKLYEIMISPAQASPEG